MTTPRILIADDHKILREGLRYILQHELHLDVIAQAPDGRTALALAEELHPDLIIMDVSMPDLNGVEATRRILDADPRIKVIALSMHTTKDFVARMLEAGATAYLLKDCAVDELGEAIRCVLGGKVYISPDIAGVVVDDYLTKLNEKSGAAPVKLTPKEREVLQLLSEGKSTKEIASLLGSSISTIETHRQHVMEKLNLFSIAELTKYAIQEGLTSLE